MANVFYRSIWFFCSLTLVSSSVFASSDDDYDDWLRMQLLQAPNIHDPIRHPLPYFHDLLFKIQLLRQGSVLTNPSTSISWLPPTFSAVTLTATGFDNGFGGNPSTSVFPAGTRVLRPNEILFPSTSDTIHTYRRLFQSGSLVDYSTPYGVDNPKYRVNNISTSADYQAVSLRSKYGQFALFNEITSDFGFTTSHRVGTFGYVSPYDFPRSPTNLNFYTSDVNRIPGLTLSLITPIQGSVWRYPDSSYGFRALDGSISEAVLDSKSKIFFGLARGGVGADEGSFGARPDTRADFAIRNSDVNVPESINKYIPGYFYIGKYKENSGNSSLSDISFFANMGWTSSEGYYRGAIWLPGGIAKTSETSQGQGVLYGRIGEGFGVSLSTTNASVGAGGFLQINRQALTSTTGAYIGKALGLRVNPAYNATFVSGSVSLNPNFEDRNLGNSSTLVIPGDLTITLDGALSTAVDREHLFGYQSGFDNKSFLGAMELPEFLVGSQRIKPQDLTWGTWNGVASTSSNADFYPGLQNFWVAARSALTSLPTSSIYLFNAANVGVRGDSISGVIRPLTNTGISSFAVDNRSNTPSVNGLIYQNDRSFAVVKNGAVYSRTLDAPGAGFPSITPTADAALTAQFSGDNASSFFFDWQSTTSAINYGVGVGVQTAIASVAPQSTAFTGFFNGYTSSGSAVSAFAANLSFTGNNTPLSLSVSAPIGFGGASYVQDNNALNVYVNKNAFHTSLKLENGINQQDSFILGVPGLESYQYLSWGIARQGATYGFFAAGDTSAMTTASQLAIVAATKSIRTYSGEAMAQYFRNIGSSGATISQILTGKADIRLDLNSGAFSGTLNFQNNVINPIGQVMLSGQVSNISSSNSVEATSTVLSGVIGSVQATVFGPRADEIGGSFSIIKDVSGVSEAIVGAFGAKLVP